jgi:O-antigen/teichoic acid export membrane protein
MKILTPSDYGLLNLIMSFVNVLAIVIGLGLRQAFFLDYFHCSSDQRRVMAREIILLYLFFSVPILLLLFANASLLNHYFFLATAPRTLIALSLLYCFFIFFSELLYQVLQYQTKAALLTILQTGTALMVVVLNLWFLWYLGYGIYSSLVAQTFGLAFVCVVGVYQFVVHGCYTVPNKKDVTVHVLRHVKQGLVFIPSMLCAWIVASSDRIILGQYTSLHVVGIYSVADLFGQLFQSLVLLPLGSAYLPMLFQKYAARKDDLLPLEAQNQRTMWAALAGAITVLTVGFWSCKGLLYWFLPVRYHEAVQYLWLLLLGYIFLMGNYFASALLQFKKKSFFLAFSLVIPAAFNIFLNFLLIPVYGIFGCVLATTFSYFIYFIITLLYNYAVQRTLL